MINNFDILYLIYFKLVFLDNIDHKLGTFHFEFKKMAKKLHKHTSQSSPQPQSYSHSLIRDCLFNQDDETFKKSTTEVFIGQETVC